VGRPASEEPIYSVKLDWLALTKFPV